MIGDVYQVIENEGWGGYLDEGSVLREGSYVTDIEESMLPKAVVIVRLECGSKGHVSLHRLRKLSPLEALAMAAE